MSQYVFILSYCNWSEKHFGTNISASSQTVLKLQHKTYHKIPSLREDIVVPGNDLWTQKVTEIYTWDPF